MDMLQQLSHEITNQLFGAETQPTYKIRLSSLLVRTFQLQGYLNSPQLGIFRFRARKAPTGLTQEKRAPQIANR